MNNSSTPKPRTFRPQTPDAVVENVEQMPEQNSPRRRFLQSAVGVAGGLALGLQVAARAEGDGTVVATSQDAEITVPIPEKVLAKVGGFDVVEVDNGRIKDKVLVARVGASTVMACSAVCTHKGCIVEYEHDSGEIVCPCHGARYSVEGKVKRGPAKRDLKPYNARMTLGISERAVG
jgi:cytochrome b6-f complex iron-sulfur subunit